MRRKVHFYVGIATAILLCGCSNFIFRDIDCFDISNELKLFPGSVGNTLTLKNATGSSLLFTIIKKVAEHISGYISDTGCSCHDYWRVDLQTDDFTFTFATTLQYIENNEGTRLEDLVIKVGSNEQMFTVGNREYHESYDFAGTQVQKVIEYKKTGASADEFSKIYLAKEIGLVRLVKGNGDTWTNTQLTPNLESGTDTWDYTEFLCE
jgi:hypothetical protein